MIAGPYGAGKRLLMLKDFGRLIKGVYIDPQEIFDKGPLEPIERVRQRAYSARFRMIRKQRELTTTCSMGSVRDLHLLDAARRNQFNIALHFFGISDWRIALRRIRTTPGHWLNEMPEEKIKGIYHRSLAMLPGAILMAQSGIIYENSEDANPRKLLRINNGRIEIIDKNLPNWLLEPLSRCL